MLDKPEHFATAKQAEQRAQGLAPQMFPQSVCIVHRPDADGKWHVCTRGEAEGKYRDALHVTYISNDGDIKPEAAEQQFTVTENEHRRRRPSRGRRGRCRGCNRRLEQDELFKLPGRKGKFCMNCAAKEAE